MYSIWYCTVLKMIYMKYINFSENASNNFPQELFKLG